MSQPSLLEAPTLWELVELRAETTPAALMAIDDRERSLTFADYRDACLRVAAGLNALGVGEGSAVSWVLPTRLDSLVLIGALARLAAIQTAIRRLAEGVVPLLPTLPDEAPPRRERPRPPDAPDPAALRRVDQARKNGHGGPR